MTTDQFFEAVAKIAGVLFVVTSMLAMGLSLTIPMIAGPLRNVRLVVLALVANFVLVPAVAYLIVTIMPIDQALKTGLIVLATAAGAPFLPKLVQGAKGDVAFGVGLMVLLMVVTIGYMPVVLPLLLPGVSVDAASIAKSLVVLMLVPLGLALLVRAHVPEIAAEWQPVMARISSLAILVLLVVGLGLNVSGILDLIGTGGFLALLLFIAGALVIGFVLGGRDPGVRSVMGLGTAQRNLAAAIVVSAQNFSGSATLSFVLAGSVVLLVILLATARVLGRRAPAPASAGTVAA
jgi:predicted Na+-dependent transporter